MKVVKPLNISFEFFPPKNVERLTYLAQEATILAQFDPLFFSVTFGAGGSTQQGTIESVRLLQEKTPVRVAPHLSCVGTKRDDLIQLLHLYKTMGVRRIVALRGDLPAGMTEVGEYQFASELVALIREVTGQYFHIEVAAYPEVHPQARSVRDDILNLKRKADAGADSAITQYFYNPDAYFYLLDDCARAGIKLPITPGIMPITQYASLARFSALCGAEIPQWIRKRLEDYADDVDAIKAFGLEVVHLLCEQLLQGGAPGLHIYTLNQSEASIKLMQQLAVDYRVKRADLVTAMV